MQNASPIVTLAARGLRKSLLREGERFELHAPEIDLVAGQVTAIVGESGAGKSTLLDMLALISAPEAAESFDLRLGDDAAVDVMALWRAGDEEGLAALRRRVGLVLQSGGLLPYLDIRGNAALARNLAGQAKDSAHIAALADALGVGAKLGVRPATLSGGERQRAAILRAMAHQPALLAADEPTAAVDRDRAEAIMQAMAAQAAQRGVACVIVSHDMALVEKVAHRLYRIEVERGEDGVSRAVCAKAAGGLGPAGAPGPAIAEKLDKKTAPARGGGGALLPSRLAAKDLFSEARFSLASIAAIAAVIAPLLLLLGLKQGVIEHQVERLVQDPRARELTPMRAVSLSPQEIERWRARSDVAFIAPGIARGASGAVVRRRVSDQAPPAQRHLMDLLASADGDPLLLENGAPAPKAGEAALTHAAAVRLAGGGEPDLMIGQTIELEISRRVSGARQSQIAAAKVVGVLDPRADPLERVYAPFAFVASVERYRSNRRDDLALGDAAPDPEQRYRGFRLYARSIHDVEGLHQSLSAEGVQAAARLGPIRTIREADQALSILLAVVGVIGVLGAFSAMAANLVSMVERKRADIALLRMMGLRRSGAFALPVVSALLIAIAATALACGVYAAAAAPINLFLAEALPFGDRISRISLLDMASALLMTCAAAAICAVFAGRRAARVEPATALRRE